MGHRELILPGQVLKCFSESGNSSCRAIRPGCDDGGLGVHLQDKTGRPSALLGAPILILSQKCLVFVAMAIVVAELLNPEQLSNVTIIQKIKLPLYVHT